MDNAPLLSPKQVERFAAITLAVELKVPLAIDDNKFLVNLVAQLAAEARSLREQLAGA